MKKFLKLVLTMIFPLIATTASAAAISGTFIQSQLFAGWDDARWQQEFNTLKQAGMDKLIFMQTVSTEADGKSYAAYNTSISGVVPAEKDLLEECLRNAEQAGVKIFVGLNFDDRWWHTELWSPEWITSQMILGNQIIREIAANYAARYPDTFAGWYWVWEVEDSFCAIPGIIEHLIAALNINLDCIARVTPELPIILSPFMNSSRNTPELCAARWGEILSKAHLKDGDIFAPQDCIGSGYLKIDHVVDWFKALAEIVPTSPKIQFWANIEDFDQRFWTTGTINRIASQIDLLKPYVSNMITFAYSHYYSPAIKTPDLHRAYCEYAATGTIPKISAPQAVTEASINDGVLTWAPVSTENSLMGYHIYSNGTLVADIQLNAAQQCRCTWPVPAEYAGTTLSIASYNVIGVDSDPKIL